MSFTAVILPFFLKVGNLNLIHLWSIVLFSLHCLVSKFVPCEEHTKGLAFEKAPIATLRLPPVRSKAKCLSQFRVEAWERERRWQRNE